MKISTDKNLNSALRAEVQELRGGIAGAAERQPTPERFTFESHPDEPAMIVTDSVTGLTSTVSLCHYAGVRKTLNDFFGD